MELDCCREPAVQNAKHRIPDHFHQSDPPEIAALPLGDQDDRLPRAFLGQCHIMECFLHNGDNLLPIGGIRCAVLSLSNQPLAEVFCSQTLTVHPSNSGKARAQPRRFPPPLGWIPQKETAEPSQGLDLPEVGRASTYPPYPARVAITTMKAEREDIYWHAQPPVHPIPVKAQPFSF